MCKIAVAMSVYNKDKAIYFEQSLASLYSQKNIDFDVFLQIDGPINSQLQQVVNKYKRFENFFCYHSHENKGLAFQLNTAISKILEAQIYTHIARMDADDICMGNRFEEQIKFFRQHPDVAALGSSIIEFDSTDNETLKAMPTAHDVLAKNIIKRCPFNHPTVMFNLDVIEFSDLKYDATLKNTQDYYLWVDLLKKGYKFANLAEPLLKFRIDENFHSRRGLQKAVNDYKSRVYAMRELGVFTFYNVRHTILLFFLRASPVFVRRWAYKHLR